VSARPPRWRVYLRLGRVSNLPTVWSNALAGIVLAGARIEWHSAALLAVAMSLFYEGGMFLNDAFDRERDARERPERPIPGGLVSACEVFVIGFALLAAGLVVLALATASRGAWITGAALAATIVLYDAWHQSNPASPVVMGLCRALVYLTAGFAVSGRLSAPLVAGSAGLLGYLIGLSYAAKQETRAALKNLWPLVFLAAPLMCALGLGAVPRGGVAAVAAFAVFVAATAAEMQRLAGARPGGIPRAIAGLIAGISLCDALLIAARGESAIAAIAFLGYPLTLALQRFVRGT